MVKKYDLAFFHRLGVHSVVTHGLLLLFWFSSPSILAQSVQLSGRFVDAQNRPLPGVPVQLVAQTDTSQKQYMLTDTSGVFRFTNMPRQTYVLKASYLGFQPFSQTVADPQLNQNLGNLVLLEQARMLQTVMVVRQVIGVRQKGDTVQFNANAYKVNRDATVEDLVRKLPGLTLENGQVKAQGQTVQQVLVDGKPFFGNDPAIALRNLPAGLIDRIEVFDQLSEQARFSGLRDGNTQKTVNIVTRADQQRSTFGRFYAGGGTRHTYQAGGNLNLFRDKQRLSILGLANTINQQNFSTQDLLGVNSGGPPKPPGASGSGGAFQVGQQPGINQTRSVGVNFSDEWGKRVTVQGSYFLNNSDNHNQQSDYRTYFLPGQENQLYQATARSRSNAVNHRLETRLEYQFDTRNSLVFRSQLSSQTSRSDSDLDAQTTFSESGRPTRQTSQYQLRGVGYTYNNSLLLRHRFGKAGRTISADLGVSGLTRETTRYQSTQTDSLESPSLTLSSQQRSRLHAPTRQRMLNLVYTEPLTMASQLHLSYNETQQHGHSVSDTRFFDWATGAYGPINDLLSSTFRSNYRTSRAMLGYHLHTKAVGFVVDMAYQRAVLRREQTYPNQNTIRTTFGNWLPAAHLEFKPDADHQWHLEYRTSLQAPSVNQLQPVIDNTNPLLIQTGNPDLKPAYGHNFQARYTHTSGTRSLQVLLNGNQTQRYIGMSTRISDDTTQGIGFVRGAQLVKPVNLSGYSTVNTQVTYSQLLAFIKTNVSVQAGYTHSRIPSRLNDQLNDQLESVLMQRVTFSSTISHGLDFYAAYGLVLSQVRNTIQQVSNNRYRDQTVEARLVWEFGPGFIVQTDLTNQRYRSFSGPLNRQYTLWNVAAGRKFLKDRRGELKLSVFDLLRQNSTISQTLTDAYFQTTQSQVLQRYFLLTFTYHLRPATGSR